MVLCCWVLLQVHQVSFLTTINAPNSESGSGSTVGHQLSLSKKKGGLTDFHTLFHLEKRHYKQQKYLNFESDCK